jgi:hypothetical protein
MCHTLFTFFTNSLSFCNLKRAHGLCEIVITCTVTPDILDALRHRANFGCGIAIRLSDWLGSSEPGAGKLKSCVWLTLVLPGRGSNAGISAENCRFRTNSSSQARRLCDPPRFSYSSSSYKTIRTTDNCTLHICKSQSGINAPINGVTKEVILWGSAW